MTSTAIELPASPREHALLRRRAERLASESTRTEEKPASALFLMVRLGARERYGIPYAHLEEIMRPRGLTSVPCTPNHIAGVLPRRGQLIAVVALGHLLPMDGRDEGGEDTRVVIIQSAGLTLGLLVDGVEGNGHWQADLLSPAPASPGVRNPDWIVGIHEGRIAILNIPKLINSLSIEEMT